MMVGQMCERVVAMLSRISTFSGTRAYIYLYTHDDVCTSVFFQRGEVDSLEGEVALLVH